MKRNFHRLRIERNVIILESYLTFNLCLINCFISKLIYNQTINTNISTPIRTKSSDVINPTVLVLMPISYYSINILLKFITNRPNQGLGTERELELEILSENIRFV